MKTSVIVLAMSADFSALCVLAPIETTKLLLPRSMVSASKRLLTASTWARSAPFAAGVVSRLGMISPRSDRRPPPPVPLPLNSGSLARSSRSTTLVRTDPDVSTRTWFSTSVSVASHGNPLSVSSRSVSLRLRGSTIISVHAWNIFGVESAMATPASAPIRVVVAIRSLDRAIPRTIAIGSSIGSRGPSSRISCSSSESASGGGGMFWMAAICSATGATLRASRPRQPSTAESFACESAAASGSRSASSAPRAASDDAMSASAARSASRRNRAKRWRTAWSCPSSCSDGVTDSSEPPRGLPDASRARRAGCRSSVSPMSAIGGCFQHDGPGSGARALTHAKQTWETKG